MAKRPTQTTDIANYDEELAALAGKAAGLTASGGGGKFFSTRAGQLSYDDAALPGNQMCVIVLGHCLENVYYAESFDADNRTPPACFAFFKGDPEAKDDMAPVPKDLDDPVFDKQSDNCAECPQNEWGSAEKGRGKACGNRRRLALIPAGSYKPVGRGGGFELEVFKDEDFLDHIAKAEVAYLKVPVTSGKLWDGYVKQLNDQMRKPPFAVLTRVYLEPDSKSQFKIQFELLEECGPEVLGTLIQRHKKIMEGIDFPYTPFESDDTDAKGGGTKQAPSKKLTGGRGAPAKKPAPRKR